MVADDPVYGFLLGVKTHALRSRLPFRADAKQGDHSPPALVDVDAIHRAPPPSCPPSGEGLGDSGSIAWVICLATRARACWTIASGSPVSTAATSSRVCSRRHEAAVVALARAA